MQPRIQRPVPGASRHEEEGVPITPDSLHDLSSPINQVCTLSELIITKWQGSLDEETHTLLGYLQDSANRLQSLLEGLRTYMQVAGSPPALRRADANALLAGAVAMLQHSIAQSEARITHDPLPKLWCDPSQITYALASLIENAIKFRGSRAPEVHVGAVPDKKSWVLYVRDNGIGVDARYNKRIFGAFKRIHNDLYPGSGVGLAITKQVVERHGGQIWLESEPGQGATFFVELPKGSERRTKPARNNEAVA